MFNNTLLLELHPLETLDDGAKRSAGYKITIYVYRIDR